MAVLKAVVRSKSPDVKPSAPRLATNPAELGALAQQSKAAQSEWTKLRDDVVTLRQQLKTATGPKKAALEKQLPSLEAKRDQAADRSSNIDRDLSQSIQALRGRKGDSRTKAQHANELLDRVGGAQLAAWAEVGALRLEKLAIEGKKPVSRTRLAEVDGKLAKAEAKVATLGAAAEAVTLDVKQQQSSALDEAQRYKPVDQRQEDLNDVASLSREEQIQLVGAPVSGVSEETAVKNDRRLVSITVQVAPENGAKMLARQLAESSSPEQQLKLVKLAANHIKTIATQAGGTAVGDAYLAALGHAKGPARKLLMDTLLKELPPQSFKFFAERLDKNLAAGTHFEVAGELLQGLKGAGRTAEAGQLTRSLVTNLGKLRGEFEKSKTKVDELNGKFSRAVFGFGEAIPPETLQGFRDQYLKKHGDAYAAFESSSGKYLHALEAAGSFPAATAVKEPSSPMEAMAMKSAPATLDSELTKLAGHSAALFESKAGQKSLNAAFELQLAGKPSMLDTMVGGVDSAKSALSLTKSSADVLARGMVAFAADKGGMDAVAKLIQKNGDLLGIPPKQVDGFIKLAAKSNLGELDKVAQQKAIDDIKQGGFGPSIAALGLLLTAPGLIKGWSNVGSASTFAQTKLAAETLGFGSDLVKLFSKGEVLQNIATRAGRVAGVVAIPLEVLTGLGELMDGKIVDGSMSLASALGAGLMMAPGGQLVGAAIILGSAIAKKIWGDDPAERAELAAEAEVKDLLKFAGLKPETAAVLSDVLQDGLRSMGPFISQMGKHLKMKPADFLKHLDEMPPAKLKELVKMAKNMPDDGNWTLGSAKTDPLDRADRQQRVGGGIYIGPKSLQTAVEWMRARQMLPAGK